jgi:REP element-mobilizing transposase RayT
MKRDHIDFQDRSQPLGYLITIRSYGTWLHGDARGSMDRRNYNKFGEPKRPVNSNLAVSDLKFAKNPPVIFGAMARMIIETAIREVCLFREIGLAAINVRTNHAHVVPITSRRPEPLMNSFKSYATRKLRERCLIDEDQKVWARHGSTRYLWTEEHTAAAVDYVLNGQGGDLPSFD